MTSEEAAQLKRGDKVTVGVMARDRCEYEVVAVGDAKRDVLVRRDGRSTSVWVAVDDVHPARRA